MNFDNWVKTYRSLKVELGISRITLAGCSIALALLAFQTLRQETIVVVQPWTLQKTAWVGKDSSSQSYKEYWGLALAQMLGNVNPSNINFIEERIGPLLPNEDYETIMTNLKAESLVIKENRLTTYFEPQSIIYERSTDKVFVTGDYYTSTAKVKTKPKKQTYEFIITLDSYLPQIKHISTYAGEAQTERYLKIQREKQKDKNSKK